MNGKRLFIPLGLLIALCSVSLFSCDQKPRPVLFPVRGTDQVLFGLSREAVEGKLNVSGQKKLEYRFDTAAALSAPASLAIEYTITGRAQPVLETASYSWFLPGADQGGVVFHYVIPVDGFLPDFLRIAFTGETSDRTDTSAHIQIRSLQLSERWYGFYRHWDSDGEHIYTTPFVSRRPDNAVWEINPPAAFAVPSHLLPVLSVVLPPQGGGVTVDAGNGLRFEASPRLERLVIPAGIIARNDQLLITPGDHVSSFRLSYAAPPSFPAPIDSDPGMILEWPWETWRSRRYEVFRWEHFPSLLIFDTADYAVQDNLFKRIAFFVEKAGFRGRLAHDDELANLHGWNAHDYRAQDLAHFFHAAHDARFPLLPEERELERILLSAGIIRESGSGIQEGEGGVISISRESADYLRRRFMAHEGFHGLFFIDEDFRAFSRGRWQRLPPEAKRFLLSFFNFQQYDTADEYLLINEFMAHMLQQPVSQAGHYFGQTLPSRLENTWRQTDLPVKEGDSWPVLAAAFTREAEAFSAYVGSRWGLAAGRVHLVSVRNP